MNDRQPDHAEDGFVFGAPQPPQPQAGFVFDNQPQPPQPNPGFVFDQPQQSYQSSPQAQPQPQPQPNPGFVFDNQPQPQPQPNRQPQPSRQPVYGSAQEYDPQPELRHQPQPQPQPSSGGETLFDFGEPSSPPPQKSGSGRKVGLIVLGGVAAVTAAVVLIGALLPSGNSSDSNPVADQTEVADTTEAIPESEATEGTEPVESAAPSVPAPATPDYPFAEASGVGSLAVTYGGDWVPAPELSESPTDTIYVPETRSTATFMLSTSSPATFVSSLDQKKMKQSLVTQLEASVGEDGKVTDLGTHTLTAADGKTVEFALFALDYDQDVRAYVAYHFFGTDGKAIIGAVTYRPSKEAITETDLTEQLDALTITLRNDAI